MSPVPFSPVEHDPSLDGSDEALEGRLRAAGAAVVTTLRNRDLRRAHLSFGAAGTSEWALTVGLAVVAFRDGGVGAVGAVALLRMLPAAIAGPFLATLVERFRRERVIFSIGLVRGFSLGLTGLLSAQHASTILLYAPAVIATLAGTPFRAAYSALIPSLCATPDQLTSASAVRGMLDSLSVLLGPLGAAVLLALSTPAAVLFAAAVASAWSGLLVLRLHYERAPRATGAGPPTLFHGTREGLAALRRQPELAVVMGLGASQTFTRGCLNVFSVAVAIDLVRIGASGVGVLSAAVGAGAVAGSFGASLLIGSRSLGGWFGLSVALWGLPLVILGVLPGQAAALGLFATIGIANALVNVSGFSLMTRLAPDDVLARVFGLFEAIIALSVGLGAILTPLMIELVGLRLALLFLGLVCPTLAVVSWRRLRAVDRRIHTRDRELALLRRVPLLRPLPMSVMDHLARHLTSTQVPAGAAVFKQGDTGELFYVIAAGSADVIGDGDRIRTLGDGDSFGEIALLRDVPRTAEVRARTDLHLYALDRDTFLPAVSGYRPSATQADAVVTSMLDTFRPRGVGV